MGVTMPHSLERRILMALEPLLGMAAITSAGEGTGIRLAFCVAIVLPS